MKTAYGACVIITAEGRAADGSLGIVGVARRNNPNSFALVGGKTEPNETEEEAATREVMEETGMFVSNLREVYRRIIDLKVDDGHDAVTFVADSYTGEPTQQEGEPECKWCSVQELLEGRFGDYNRQAFLKAGILK